MTEQSIPDPHTLITHSSLVASKNRWMLQSSGLQ
jgi:hypothetical protein